MQYLKVLSPALRGEVALQQCGHWLAAVPFFCCKNGDERRRFAIEVCSVLQRACYIADELLYQMGAPADRMYIIQSGLVGSRGRLLGKGRYLGSEMVMATAVRSAPARAMSFVDAQTLSREHVLSILKGGCRC